MRQYETLKTEKQGKVVVATLHRPDDKTVEIYDLTTNPHRLVQYARLGFVPCGSALKKHYKLTLAEEGDDVSPDFTGEAFHVIGEGAVRIVPIEIIATVLAFALSPVTWRALRALGTGK